MKSVLIVDDSSIVRKFIKNIFLQLDFEVAEAEDGQVALDQVKRKTPDVIMLDWYMPVIDGLNFVIKLREQEEGKKPVVIFCTTENEVHKIEEAMAAGANEFIMKPFDIDIIKSKLQQLGVL